MRKAATLLVVLTAASVSSSPESNRLEPGARARVTEASLIVVATLISTDEITANGFDFGQGPLQVEAVLYPEGFTPARLLLRWRNPTGIASPRIDPRALDSRRSLWLLRMESDGTVSMVDSESALPLREEADLESFLEELWPFDETAYGRKALAVEALVRSLPADAGSFHEPVRDEDVPLIHDRMAFALRDYRSCPDFKAFAVAIDAKGRWVYGFRHEHPTEELAVEGALFECSWRAAKRRVDAPCRIYAVGDRLLWED